MKIIICGNYGATNIGDELILKGILKYLGARTGAPTSANINSRHEITVLSANPGLTQRLHKINSMAVLPAGPRSFVKGMLGFSFLRTLSAIKKCDLFILGGGGLFDDTYPRASLIWGIQALAAHMYKKPLIILANSFGPLKTFAAKLITRLVCDYSRLITVRDEGSKKLLQQMGIKKKITVAADPAFGLTQADLCNKKPVKKTEKPYVVFALRKSNKNFVQLANLLDWIHKKYGFQIKLISFQKIIQDNTGFQKKFSNKKFIHVLPYADDFCAIYKTIENAEAVVGMRLHSLILAILAEKPFLALTSFDKIKNLLASEGLANLALDINDKNLSKNFKTAFENLIKNQSSYIAAISLAKAKFQQKSEENKKALTKALKSL
ncbi:polysaccharide pyruvyl transferase family protein [Candidatus Peregrinibacteria bacterium]|nr:polysaccharide pyruvyl transferase family protein [Candidatus Peregrinibacteria bacterium]